MTLIWRAAALAASLCCWAVNATAADVDGGSLEGVRDGAVTVYKGIPFAAPPLGELRWREPQPVVPWSGTRAAKEFAPACMQTGVSMPGETPPAISEDCLYLNIWTPASGVHDRLPVLVWIYGGGFGNGSAAMPLYWGDKLAAKGIVVVTVAYRVGPFGFLAHPELTRESARRSSGNYGLMDQVAALKWVQRNIAAFGGDAARVTIAGQSAGSMSVSILMASPLAKGLFARAIGESGGFFEPVQLAPNFLLPNAEHDGEAFAASLGAAGVAALRRMPAEQILKGKMPSGPHPVIEPYLLPQPPFDVFAAGRQNDVPVLIGANAEEARALIDLKSVKAATFDADIAKAFGALPPQLMAAYPHSTDAEALRARVDFESDLRFRWDMWAWARLQASTGKHNVYFYRFAQKPPFPENSVRAGWDASHFAELWYVFDHLSQEPWRWTAADHRLSGTISAYWANFVKTGDPNGDGQPHWPAFKSANGPMLTLGDPVSSGDVVGLDKLQVFDAVYGQVRRAPMK
jgi:para-nitrobenzyl esterase